MPRKYDFMWHKVENKLFCSMRQSFIKYENVGNECKFTIAHAVTCDSSGLGGVVVIDAAIGAHGRGSRPAHYFTVAATLDKSV